MNVDYLRTALEADVYTRESRITSLVTLTSRYDLRKEDEALLVCSTFPLIYAEWEAFYVSSIKSFFEEIDKQEYNLEELHPNYYVHNTELTFKQFLEYPGKEKIKQKYAFLTSLKPYFNSDPIILDKEVNTESNLGFQVMNGLFKLYNMDIIPDKPFGKGSIKSELNSFLLHKRNAVAHGDNSISISKEDLNRAKMLVFNLMEMTKEIIISGAENDCYLKSN